MVNKDPKKSMFSSPKELNHCKPEQDFHHYAYDENGELIFIQEGYIYDRKDYKCLACGEAMRPVMGEERVWHFRHKNNNSQCNKETYLHRLAKALIKERFDKEESFFITYNIKETCPNINICPHRSEKCYSTKRHKIDLKEIYDTCEVEETDGNSLYRADLKISSNKRSDTKPIFIEVDCTHDCTPEKIESGIQIIELKINGEDDILKPLEEAPMLFLDYENPNNPYYNSEKPVIGFYNFNRIIHEKKYKRDCLYLKAKRAIKRRFNNSETFPISYTRKNICPLRENCNLASSKCDHHIINIPEDLKKTYNKCDENKQGEIVLSNTDKDIAPLIFKFSFDRKPQYETNRRIIEFGNYYDVTKKEIKDHERMHINFNNANPYDGYRLPSIRFYNFKRSEISPFSIQLKRFFVIKKGKELLAILDNTNCISEYERPKDIIYELLFPSSYFTDDMLLLGIMKANLKGIAIHNCFLCRHCHRYQNGCIRYGKYMANLLADKNIDKFKESKNCPRYSCLDFGKLKFYIANKWGNIPCREWKSPYY